jgi:hypothetical protein|tara:strand:+ start:6069 stop:6443 length:375 start_codon:yes stop_codon:yes gene_type:complete
MSAMTFTYLTNIKGVALVDGDGFKKGDSIPVQVYELYTSSRGGGTSRSKNYYFGNEPTMEDIKNVMSMPRSQRLSIDKDFKVSQETSTGTSQASTSVEGLTNNKTVMWLGIIVVGYFAYKQYKK